AKSAHATDLSQFVSTSGHFSRRDAGASSSSTGSTGFCGFYRFWKEPGEIGRTAEPAEPAEPGEPEEPARPQLASSLPLHCTCGRELTGCGECRVPTAVCVCRPVPLALISGR